MQSLAEISEKDFEAGLEGSQILRGMQILHAAFAFGIISYAMIVALMALGIFPIEAQKMPEDAEGSFLPMLSLIHGVMAIILWSVGIILFNVRFSPESLKQTASDPGDTGQRFPVGFSGQRGNPFANVDMNDPVNRCLAHINAAYLLRAAFFEGVGLFGLTICLLGILLGDIQDQPLFWLNSITAIVLILFIAITFPTRDRLVDLFRMKIAPHRE